MTKVRAKFTVTNNEKYGSAHSVRLAPVFGGSAENDRFFAVSPGGAIALEVVAAETAARFEVGKSYYVDFSPAE